MPGAAATHVAFSSFLFSAVVAVAADASVAAIGVTPTKVVERYKARLFNKRSKDRILVDDFL